MKKETNKQKIEAVLLVGVVLTALLLLCSIVLEQVSLYSLFVALSGTYLFVFYWEKSLAKKKNLDKKRHLHTK